ncbi:MAG: hypothetical protein ACR2QK_22890 [Acidimicrobiales bacterium]
MDHMSRLSEFIEEWKARRAGRRHVSNDIYRRARDITGATGWVTSRAWDHADRHGEAYSHSLVERRVPPSLHISARDQIRSGKAMPLTERCIEDFNSPDSERPGDWSISELEGS